VRARSCLLLAALAAAPWASAWAGPPSEDRLESDHVLPPGREPALRALLEPVVRETPADLRWLGPTVEFDRVKWWLMRGEQADAMLLLAPRELAEAGDPVSMSFAIQVAWPPEREPDARERALLERAIEEIKTGDHGQFYVMRVLTPEQPKPEPEPDPVPPYAVQPADDPDAVRRQWLLEVGGLLVLALAATVAVMRRR
jgi:hypothetical protein